jgi:isocitrate dehydrogenase (NAD+)
MAAGASIGGNYALFAQGCRHTGKDIAGNFMI